MALPLVISNTEHTVNGGNHGTFYNDSTGETFVILVDSTNAYTLEIHSSTDPSTVSFSAEYTDDFANDTGAEIRFIDAVQVSNILHIIVGGIITGGVRQYRYWQYNMTTSSVVVADQLAYATPDSVLVNTEISGEIAVRSDGSIVLVLQYDPEKVHGSDWNRVYYVIRSTGGTWGTPVQVDAGGQVDYYFYSAELGASDLVHIIIEHGSNFYHLSLNSSNTLSGEEQVNDTTILGWRAKISFVNDGTDNIAVITWGTGSSPRYYAESRVVNDGTPTAETDITSTATIANTGVVLHLTAAENNSDTSSRVYGIYHHDVDNDLYFNTYTPGSGWGTDAVIESGITANRLIAANVFTRDDGDFVLSYVYDDATNGPTYNEYVIRAAVVPITATIEATAEPVYEADRGATYVNTPVDLPANYLFAATYHNTPVITRASDDAQYMAVLHDNGSSNTGIQVLKSTDDGETWAQIGTATNSYNTNAKSVGAYAEGENLHILMQDNNVDIRYWEFNCTTESYTIQRELAYTVIDFNHLGPVDLVVRSDGSVIGCFSGRYITTNDNSHCYYIERTAGGSWQSAVRIDASSGYWKGVKCALGDSDDVHFLYFKYVTGGNDTDLEHRTLNSSNSLSSTVPISSGFQGPTSSAIIDFHDIVYHVNGSNKRVSMAWIQILGSNDDVRYRYRDNNTTLGSADTLAIGADIADDSYIRITANPTSDKVSIFVWTVSDNQRSIKALHGTPGSWDAELIVLGRAGAYNLGLTNNSSFGNNTQYDIGNFVDEPYLEPIVSATFRLRKFGSPTDNLLVELYDAVDGTLLGTSDTVAGTSLTTSIAAYTFNFPAQIEIYNKVFFRVRRTGAADNVNYYQGRRSSTFDQPYLGGWYRLGTTDGTHTEEASGYYFDGSLNHSIYFGNVRRLAGVTRVSDGIHSVLAFDDSNNDYVYQHWTSSSVVAVTGSITATAEPVYSATTTTAIVANITATAETVYRATGGIVANITATAEPEYRATGGIVASITATAEPSYRATGGIVANIVATAESDYRATGGIVASIIATAEPAYRATGGIVANIVATAEPAYSASFVWSNITATAEPAYETEVKRPVSAFVTAIAETLYGATSSGAVATVVGSVTATAQPLYDAKGGRLPDTVASFGIPVNGGYLGPFVDGNTVSPNLDFYFVSADDTNGGIGIFKNDDPDSTTWTIRNGFDVGNNAATIYAVWADYDATNDYILIWACSAYWSGVNTTYRYSYTEYNPATNLFPVEDETIHEFTHAGNMQWGTDEVPEEDYFFITGVKSGTNVRASYAVREQVGNKWYERVAYRTKSPTWGSETQLGSGSNDHLFWGILAAYDAIIFHLNNDIYAHDITATYADFRLNTRTTLDHIRHVARLVNDGVLGNNIRVLWVDSRNPRYIWENRVASDLSSQNLIGVQTEFRMNRNGQSSDLIQISYEGDVGGTNESHVAYVDNDDKLYLIVDTAETDSTDLEIWNSETVSQILAAGVYDNNADEAVFGYLMVDDGIVYYNEWTLLTPVTTAIVASITATAEPDYTAGLVWANIIATAEPAYEATAGGVEIVGNITAVAEPAYSASLIWSDITATAEPVYRATGGIIANITATAEPAYRATSGLIADVTATAEPEYRATGGIVASIIATAEPVYEATTVVDVIANVTATAEPEYRATGGIVASITATAEIAYEATTVIDIVANIIVTAEPEYRATGGIVASITVTAEPEYLATTQVVIVASITATAEPVYSATTQVVIVASIIATAEPVYSATTPVAVLANIIATAEPAYSATAVEAIFGNITAIAEPLYEASVIEFVVATITATAEVEYYAAVLQSPAANYAIIAEPSYEATVRTGISAQIIVTAQPVYEAKAQGGEIVASYLIIAQPAYEAEIGGSIEATITAIAQPAYDAKITGIYAHILIISQPVYEATTPDAGQIYPVTVTATVNLDYEATILFEVVQTYPQHVKRYLAVAPRTELWSAKTSGQLELDPVSGAIVGIYYDPDFDPTGDASLVLADMSLDIGTSQGGRELGTVRLRKTIDEINRIVYINEISYGELPVVPDLWLTAREEYTPRQRLLRLVAKRTGGSEYVNEFTEYHDYDISYGNQNSFPQTILNIEGQYEGYPIKHAGWSKTEGIHTGHFVWFDASKSFSINNSTIPVTWEWDFKDGTIVDDVSDTRKRVVFPSGFRWVELKVTDNKSKISRRHIPVWSFELDTYEPLTDSGTVGFSVSSDVTERGRSMNFSLFGDINAVSELVVPEGTIVCYFEEATFGEDQTPEPFNYRKQYIGWATNDAVEVKRTSSYSLETRGIEGWLDRIAGFGIQLNFDQSPSAWYEVPNLNPDVVVAYILRQFTTVLELANYYPFFNNAVWSDMRIQSEAISSGSIWKQLSGLVPSYDMGEIGCDSVGGIHLTFHPSYPSEELAARPETNYVFDIDAEDIPDSNPIRGSSYMLSKTVGLVKGTGARWNGSSASEPTVMASEAPGKVEGQGAGKESLPFIRLRGGSDIESQERLNELTGHHFARKNDTQQDIQISLIGNYDVFEPARGDLIQLNISVSNLRNFSFDPDDQFKIKRVSINHSAERGQKQKSITLTVERVTKGLKGITVPIEVDQNEDDPFGPLHWNYNPATQFPEPLPVEALFEDVLAECQSFVGEDLVTEVLVCYGLIWNRLTGEIADTASLGEEFVQWRNISPSVINYVLADVAVYRPRDDQLMARAAFYNNQSIRIYGCSNTLVEDPVWNLETEFFMTGDTPTHVAITASRNQDIWGVAWAAKDGVRARIFNGSVWETTIIVGSTQFNDDFSTSADINLDVCVLNNRLLVPGVVGHGQYRIYAIEPGDTEATLIPNVPVLNALPHCMEVTSQYGWYVSAFGNPESFYYVSESSNPTVTDLYPITSYDIPGHKNALAIDKNDDLTLYWTTHLQEAQLRNGTESIILKSTDGVGNVAQSALPVTYAFMWAYNGIVFGGGGDQVDLSLDGFNNIIDRFGNLRTTFGEDTLNTLIYGGTLLPPVETAPAVEGPIGGDPEPPPPSNNVVVDFGPDSHPYTLTWKSGGFTADNQGVGADGTPAIRTVGESHDYDWIQITVDLGEVKTIHDILFDFKATGVPWVDINDFHSNWRIGIGVDGNWTIAEPTLRFWSTGTETNINQWGLVAMSQVEYIHPTESDQYYKPFPITGQVFDIYFIHRSPQPQDGLSGCVIDNLKFVVDGATYNFNAENNEPFTPTINTTGSASMTVQQFGGAQNSLNCRRISIDRTSTDYVEFEVDMLEPKIITGISFPTRGKTRDGLSDQLYSIELFIDGSLYPHGDTSYEVLARGVFNWDDDVWSTVWMWDRVGPDAEDEGTYWVNYRKYWPVTGQIVKIRIRNDDPASTIAEDLLIDEIRITVMD